MWSLLESYFLCLYLYILSFIILLLQLLQLLLLFISLTSFIFIAYKDWPDREKNNVSWMYIKKYMNTKSPNEAKIKALWTLMLSNLA